MDDPWGSSPWADEVHLAHPSKAFVKGDDGSIRATTPTPYFGLSTSDIVHQTTTSPWDDAGAAQDNDGFGAWADGPSKADVGLDGALEDWGNSRPTGNHNLNNLSFSASNPSTITWDDTTSTQKISLARPAPSLSVEAASVVRQPSPDPWGFGDLNSPRAGLNSPHRERPNDNSEDSTSVVNQDAGNVDVGIETPGPALAPVSDNPGDIGGLQPSSVLGDVPRAAVHSIIAGEIGHDSDSLSKTTIQTVSLPNAPEVDPTSSRPSSAPSDESRRDEALAESPRTSLDDEPKRHQMPRQSSKVHQLVEHFDTLAKREGTPGVEDGRSSAAGKNGHGSEDKDDEIEEKENSEDHKRPDTDAPDEGVADDDDDFGDFGDFEDGQSDMDEPAAQLTDSKVDTFRTHPAKVKGEPLDLTPGDSTTTSFGPIEFSPNVALLGKLYQGLSEDPIPERTFVPDVVPHDSFSSTEERKMWYRLSRYGPMRKHESGDDENYVRVNWTKSQIREETLKVVARWIEEDRISGRVVLGGASKAGSIFGWNDSKPNPASIDLAFAERNSRKKNPSVSSVSVAEIPREWPKGLTRNRSTSNSHSISKTRRKSSAKSINIMEKSDVEKEKVSEPAVLAFGWSSNTIPDKHERRTGQSQSSHKAADFTTGITSASKSISSNPPLPITSSPRSSESASKSSDVPLENSAFENHLAAIISPTMKNVTSNAIPPKAVDTDDDWGEMMSSPVVASTPALPVNNNLTSGSQEPGRLLSPMEPTSVANTPTDDLTGRVDQSSTPTSSTAQPPSTFGELDSVFDSGDLTSQPTKDRGMNPSISRSSNSDAWASADFSFFDSAPTALSVPEPKNATLVAATPSTSSKSVVAHSSTAKPKRSKEEMEQDKIVEGILRSLPDLTYMLRR